LPPPFLDQLDGFASCLLDLLLNDPRCLHGLMPTGQLLGMVQNLRYYGGRCNASPSAKWHSSADK
jgi:hypothetical protein